MILCECCVKYVQVRPPFQTAQPNRNVGYVHRPNDFLGCELQEAHSSVAPVGDGHLTVWEIHHRARVPADVVRAKDRTLSGEQLEIRAPGVRHDDAPFGDRSSTHVQLAVKSCHSIYTSTRQNGIESTTPT